MLRANIYSIEPLTPVAREAIHDGLGMVAAYMGHTIATKELAVRLPLKDNGTVNPRRVGFANLEKMVELHVMAVPLDPGESEAVGYAGVGGGWSFVDTATHSPELIRTTSAHEAAHAFGFVRQRVGHEDSTSHGHCCNGTCIMHRKVMIETYQEEVRLEASRRSRLTELFRRGRPPITPVPKIRLAHEQYDFCLPCKVDLRDKGEEQIAKLRHNRLFVWKGVKR
jgi:hypothetical protein